MKLHIPGPITGIVGPQGAGKSFIALKLALELANTRKLSICFNFSVDFKALYDYCCLKGYTHLLSQLLANKIQVKSAYPLDEFLSDRRTLYLLDEAGVYLNTRSFRKVSSRFLSQLAQVRHDSQLLWWIAQDFEQVDRQLRFLTVSIIQADCSTRWSNKLDNFEIWYQKFFLYLARDYKIYSEKVAEKVRGIKHFIRQKQLSMYSFSGFLSEEDKLMFDIYQSFGYKVGEDCDDSYLEPSFVWNRTYKKVTESSEMDLIESHQLVSRAKSLNLNTFSWN